MNATRTSSVKVMGRWINVPNWVIVERKPWSTEKKNRERDRAARIGQLEAFLIKSPILPTTAVVAFLAFMIGATELIESINL